MDRLSIVAIAALALAPSSAALGQATSRPVISIVYQHDFGTGAGGAEWSTNQLDRPPGEPRRTFLGPFANETVTLTVPNLPPHAMARVSLTLHTIQSWDGSLFRGWKGSAFGPDVWAMDVVDADGGRRNLVRATFSNTALTPNFKAVGALQSFPYPLAADRVTAGTGATTRASLGYVHPNLPDVAEDATYQVAFLFPHDAPTLTVALHGSGLSGGARDEHWGIARAVATVFPAAPSVVAEELPALFDKACGIDDPFEAQLAFQQLAVAGDAVVDLIEERVEPGPAVDLALLREWVAALPADGNVDGAVANDFGNVEPAEENLVRLGWPAEPHLAAMLDATKPGPARPRLARVLNRIRTTPLGAWPDRQRAVALRLLEIVGTPKARALRATLAPTAEAK